MNGTRVTQHTPDVHNTALVVHNSSIISLLHALPMLAHQSGSDATFHAFRTLQRPPDACFLAHNLLLPLLFGRAPSDTSTLPLCDRSAKVPRYCSSQLAHHPA